MKPRLMVSQFGRPPYDWAASSGSCGPECPRQDRHGDERREKAAWPVWVARLRSHHAVALAAACLIGISTVAIAQTMTTAKDVQEDLEKQGYTQIHDIKIGGDAITAKATKDGKERSLTIDSYGKVIGSSD